MTDAKKRTFSIKDWIGLTISVIAIVFSVITYYYSNLYIKDDMEARFFESPGSSEFVRDTMHFRFMLLNIGNKPGVVLSVGYRFGKDMDGSGFGHDFNVDSIPFVLKPDFVKFITLPIPVREIADNFDSGDTAMTKDIPSQMASTFNFTMTVTSMNSRGEEFVSQSQALATITVSRKGKMLRGSGLADYEQRMAVKMPLYHNGQVMPVPLSVSTPKNNK